MTEVPHIVDMARSADESTLPSLRAELAAAVAMVDARLQLAPKAPAPVALEDEPDYSCEEAAALLGLMKKDNVTPNPGRIYTLTRRSYDPLPFVRYGAKALRIPRAKMREWRKRQEERRRG